MRTVTKVEELRAACDGARRAGLSVGLVPTMGFLHEGHRSLMQAAGRADDFVVVTIFVNPLQFGPNEDLAAYPRDLDHDAEVAESEGVAVLFVPGVTEMYPDPPRTTVHVDGLTDGLCGAARPTHFDGVTTVVAKLFAIVGPSRAYFGRKDAQQLAVVTRMARDLNLPVEVVGCPLVREADGVAMSSRNAYLDAEDRTAARVLSRALGAAADAVEAGERDAATLRAGIRSAIGEVDRVGLEYVEVGDAVDLEPVGTITGPVLIALAAQVGKARLIDNVGVTFRPDGTAHVDRGIAASTIGTVSVPSGSLPDPLPSESETPCAAG
ncbi:MAG: pantoate--beta-alanine ligase [Actinomycetia bacterium]|nr:pantoate--beta-alanine ligase [Actinomycetes bacterium]